MAIYFPKPGARTPEPEGKRLIEPSIHIGQGRFFFRGKPIDLDRVVTINYEDREQVERLLRCHPWHGWGAAGVHDMQDALREFAAPTPLKLDEPQGLGAVVEDAAGNRWLRTTSPENDRDHLDKPWLSGVIRSHWRAVTAVRVLSEGVPHE